MPIYEYKCKCGYIFEDLTQYGVSVKMCPKCKGKAKRIISRTSLKFVGSGFYCNDYKNKE